MLDWLNDAVDKGSEMLGGAWEDTTEFAGSWWNDYLDSKPTPNSTQDPNANETGNTATVTQQHPQSFHYGWIIGGAVVLLLVIVLIMRR
ncbi:hypothetical protein IFO68_10790 [Photobacterium sp. CAU 1568]|uniref:Uncharacterized protein n=1 Tax=Photobacterium arenosum TaxID=2774143 RepID=A0ABR9BKT7_9GAMM|nr:hypothetical protein [Photobacterium arenosum]MBD8513160.1 hypothetical protein [Photobacterium arenosum]